MLNKYDTRLIDRLALQTTNTKTTHPRDLLHQVSVN